MRPWSAAAMQARSARTSMAMTFSLPMALSRVCDIGTHWLSASP